MTTCPACHREIDAPCASVRCHCFHGTVKGGLVEVPCPERIAELCEEIRSNWQPEEFLRRLRVDWRPMPLGEIPEIPGQS